MAASMTELRVLYSWPDGSDGRINGFNQSRKLVTTVLYMVSTKGQIRRRAIFSTVCSMVSELYVNTQRPSFTLGCRKSTGDADKIDEYRTKIHRGLSISGASRSRHIEQ